MIKLLDNPKIIEKLCTAEPYMGSIFMAAATAFYDSSELMTVWTELDEHGNTISALNVGTEELMLLCGKNLPGAEMLAFMSKLAEDDKITEICCGDGAFPVLKAVFGENTEVLPLMKCSKHIKYSREGIPPFVKNDIKGFYTLVCSEFDGAAPDYEMWVLKMARNINRGQSEIVTIEQDGKPVSGACIRGRSPGGGGIVSVVTLPEYRGRGFGSAVTAECAEILKSQGLSSWLCPCDDRANRLYSRLGFKPCGNFNTIYLDKEENSNE